MARRIVVMAVAALAGTAAGCAAPSARGDRAPDPDRAVAEAATTSDHFCSDAQRLITASRVPAVNTVYTDRDAFVSSKASARPLQTRQYGTYEDESRTQLKMVSCKMKTADHIRTEYGADQAGADASCASLNQHSLDAVLATLSRAERRRLAFGGAAGRIVVEPDEVVDNGGDWLKPFTSAWVDPGGVLHLKAKGMNKGWLDPRHASAQPQFRGVRYCHLVAPEYLRRVLLGDATP
jgi:hypothetical protein